MINVFNKKISTLWLHWLEIYTVSFLTGCSLARWNRISILPQNEGGSKSQSWPSPTKMEPRATICWDLKSPTNLSSEYTTCFKPKLWMDNHHSDIPIEPPVWTYLHYNLQWVPIVFLPPILRHLLRPPRCRRNCRGFPSRGGRAGHWVVWGTAGLALLCGDPRLMGQFTGIPHYLVVKTMINPWFRLKTFALTNFIEGNLPCFRWF